MERQASRIPSKITLPPNVKRKGVKPKLDPKVATVMKKIDIDNVNDFRKQSSIRAVEDLRVCLARSTMEDYTWRVIQQLKNDPDFPPDKITPYRTLWKDYGGVAKSNKKPTGNPRGRPRGVKNTC